MPLQNQRSDGEAYIVDEIIYLDTENGPEQISGTNADVLLSPFKVLQDVVSIEVADIQIDRSAASMFTVYNKLDFEFEVDDRTGSDPVYYQFTVTMPLSDPNAEPMEIYQLFDQAFNRQVRIEFTDGNWLSSGSAFNDPSYQMYFNIYAEDPFESSVNPDAPNTIGFDTGSIITKMTLLFASGPNADTLSAGPLLGFDKEDYDFTTIEVVFFDTIYYYVGVSQNNMNFSPYNYIDITIDEVPELNPVFRFFPKTYFSTRSQILPVKPRLLTEPIKKLEKLTLRYRLEGGFLPQVPPPLYLSLRIFHLLEGNNVPDYLKNRPIVK